jgi:hypothetical protein
MIRSRSLLLSLVLALTALAPAVQAQQAPTPEEVHQAQTRWAEGKAAFDAGNYEAARVAFKQAYTIFQHPAFLQNLGEAELRTGRMVEAARHLTLFLRASSTGSPAQREYAKKSLKRASEKLGALLIDTNVDEAEVRVDGELIGLTPLGGLVWHVAPGSHVVTGHKEGYLDGSERVQVPAGPPTQLLVRLQRVIGLPANTPAEKPPVPAAPALAKATPPAEPTAPTAPAPSDAAHSGSVDARTVVLVSGALATIVSAGLGVGFTLRARDDSAARDRTLNKLANAGVDVTRYCNNPSADASETCGVLNEQGSRLYTDRVMQFVGFIGAGVLGAATIATIFVWQPSSTQTTQLTPIAAPGFAGVQWTRSF